MKDPDSINRQFRLNDIKRWQSQEFVIGYEIRRSNNPDHHSEICGRLVGRYPKSFIWSGWHDGCKCYIIPILQDEKELSKVRVSKFRAALNGEDCHQTEPKDTIKVLPAKFLGWYKQRVQQMLDSNIFPDFVRDNIDLIKESADYYTLSEEELTVLKFAGDQRLRIMNESSQIIENTNNIETLIGRKQDIEEHLDWFDALEKEASPLSLDGGVAATRIKLNKRINEMIYRIAKTAIDLYKLKMDQLKTEDSKKQNTIKTFEFLDRCKSVLIQGVENYEEASAELESFRQSVEDLYSIT
jgi:hypothetical protein